LANYREAGGSLRYLYWFQGRGKLEITDAGPDERWACSSRDRS
jgi:hypothetical protein